MSSCLCDTASVCFCPQCCDAERVLCVCLWTHDPHRASQCLMPLYVQTGFYWEDSAPDVKDWEVRLVRLLVTEIKQQVINPSSVLQHPAELLGNSWPSPGQHMNHVRRLPGKRKEEEEEEEEWAEASHGDRRKRSKDRLIFIQWFTQ